MYTFDQYFWLEITNTYTTKQSIFFHHLVLQILFKLFVQWHPINAQNLQKVKIVGKGGCVQHHFSKKRAQWPNVFISLLNSALNFLQHM